MHDKLSLNILSRSQARDGADGKRNALSEACFVYAEAASCVFAEARGFAYVQILETIYLAATLIFLPICDLPKNYGVSYWERNHTGLTRTLIGWLDITLHRCLSCITGLKTRDIALVKAVAALQGLVLACVFLLISLLADS